MPRGVPKSASAVSVPSTSTRTASARSAKTKANASLMDHADADIDALIRKHDKKGARGFGKTRGAAAATATADIDSARSRSPTTISTAAEAEAAEAATVRGQVTSGAGRSDLGTDGLMSEGNGESNVIEQAPSDPPKPTKKSASKKATTTSSSKKAAAGTKARKGTKTVSAKRQIQDSATSRTDENEADYAKRPARILGETAHHTNRLAAPPFETRNKEVEANMSDSPGKLPRSPHKHKSPKKVAAYLQSPVSRGKRKAMSEGQIQSFLDNYDLEAENRVRIAMKTLQISIDSARTQMHAKAIARLPRAVRLMRLGDFVDEYGADVQAAVERAAVTANRAREGEWEEEKLQRKRKDVNGEEDEKAVRGKGKNARTEPTQNASTGEGRTAATSTSTALRRAKSKTVAPANARRAQPSKVPVPSPTRSTSTVRPPSASSFSPRLGGQGGSMSTAAPLITRTPANNKPRTARTGEQVQWTSLNGSPIIGVVGPDGTIHAMPKTAGQSPSKAKQRNWEPIDEDDEDEHDAAETSAHLLELANGLDVRQLTVPIAQSSAAESPASQGSMHTAPGTRRQTMDLESEDGGDVFEEARSLPDDDTSSLPDEEAYTAQILREEAMRRERTLAGGAAARSSGSAHAATGRSSGSGNNTSFGLGGHTAARNSQSTIRPSGRKAASNGVTAGQLGSSSPMVRSKAVGGHERDWRQGSSSSSSGATTSTSSSSPQKGRVSIVFGSGSQQRITRLGIEDLMRLPSHERTQMLEILEKLRRTQLASSDS